MRFIRYDRPRIPWVEIRELYFASGYNEFEPNPDLSEIENCQVILAMDGEKPAGFAIWRKYPDKDYGKVVGLAVVKSHQGTTLAWRLVKAMCKEALQSGLNRLSFAIHKSNLTMQRFTEKVGCPKYGQDETYNFYYLPIKE